MEKLSQMEPRYASPQRLACTTQFPNAFERVFFLFPFLLGRSQMSFPPVRAQSLAPPCLHVCAVRHPSVQVFMLSFQLSVAMAPTRGSATRKSGRRPKTAGAASGGSSTEAHAIRTERTRGTERLERTNRTDERTKGTDERTNGTDEWRNGTGRGSGRTGQTSGRTGQTSGRTGHERTNGTNEQTKRN